MNTFKLFAISDFSGCTLVCRIYGEDTLRFADDVIYARVVCFLNEKLRIVDRDCNSMNSCTSSFRQIARIVLRNKAIDGIA